MNKYIILIIVVIAFGACSQEESPLFEGGSYIFFRKAYTDDSTQISFFFYPDQKKVNVWLKFEAGGEIFTEDIPLKFSIDEKLTTVKPEDYNLPQNAVFHARHKKDSVELTLNYSDKLKDNYYRIVINIEPTDQYTPGPKSFRKTKIIFTAIPSRPEWWDKTIEKVYLGKYSDLKYQTLMTVTKVSDWSNLEPFEKRALALKFKYYLQECAEDPNIGPILDEDKRPMTITVIG